MPPALTLANAWVDRIGLLVVTVPLGGLGLIPVLVALPPAKSSSWASRLDGGIMGSLVGTFIGFWLGLVIGLVVLFFSSKATLTLQCWGYTPAILAALLGMGGWLRHLGGTWVSNVEQK